MAHSIGIYDKDDLSLSLTPPDPGALSRGATAERALLLKREADKDNPYAWFTMGVAALARKDKGPAFTYFEHAAALGHAVAAYLSGRNHARQGRHEVAANYFAAALRINPAHSWSAAWLYLERLHLHESEKALSELRGNLAKTPTTWPRPLLERYAGALTFDQVLAAADVESQRCEAYVYERHYQAVLGNDAAVSLPSDCQLVRSSPQLPREIAVKRKLALYARRCAN